MSRSLTLPILFVAILRAAPALAGGVGSVGQVPGAGHSPISVGAVGIGSGGGNSIDSLVNSSSINVPGGIGSISSASTSFTTPHGVSVQTSIDSGKNIYAQTNVDVNETINGQDIAYGLNGADVLNVIDQAGADAQAMAVQPPSDQELQQEIDEESFAISALQGY